jgi:hypothetical protein
MARRKEPGQKEYNPLDDARGRLPIEEDLIRDVVAERPLAEAAAGAAAAVAEQTVVGEEKLESPVMPMATPVHLDRNPPPRPAAVPLPRAGKPAIVLEKLTAQNKFLTTPREKLELDRLAAHLSGALGTSVKPSQIIRACLNLLLRAEYEIMRRAERQPPIKRPSNAEAVALAEFDQMLAELLSHAFRDFGPIKPRQ